MDQPALPYPGVRRAVVLLTLAVLVACVVWFALLFSDRADLTWLQLLLPVAVLLVVRRHFVVAYLSPVWIAVLGLTLTGLGGAAFQSHLNGSDGGGLTLSLDPELITRTVHVFAFSATAVVFGACSVALHRTPVTSRSLPKIVVTDKTRSIILGLAAAPWVLSVVTLNSQLLTRPSHLVTLGGTSMAAVTGQLASACVALTGYLMATESGPRRWTALGLSLLYLVLSFSLSSRSFALWPLLLVVGAIAGGVRRPFLWLSVSVLASACALPIPLYLRELGSHGLLPYLHALPSFSYAHVDWASTLTNVLIAFPITGVSGFNSGHLPFSFLWISLNPLPGTTAGFYNISPYLRLNNWTPFSAVGELANYGTAPMLVIWFGIGAALAYLDGRVSHYINRGRGLVAVTLVGLSGLLTLHSLQYNLRPTIRILLYALLLDALLRYMTRPSAAAARESSSPAGAVSRWVPRPRVALALKYGNTRPLQTGGGA